MLIQELFQIMDLFEGYCNRDEEFNYPKFARDFPERKLDVELGGKEVWLTSHAVCRLNETKRHIPDEVIIHALQDAYKKSKLRFDKLPIWARYSNKDTDQLYITVHGWPAQIVLQNHGDRYYIRSLYRGDRQFNPENPDVKQNQTHVFSLPDKHLPSVAVQKLPDIANMHVRYSLGAWLRKNAKQHPGENYLIKIETDLINKIFAMISASDHLQSVFKNNDKIEIKTRVDNPFYKQGQVNSKKTISFHLILQKSVDPKTNEPFLSLTRMGYDMLASDVSKDAQIELGNITNITNIKTVSEPPPIRPIKPQGAADRFGSGRSTASKEDRLKYATAESVLLEYDEKKIQSLESLYTQRAKDPSAPRTQTIKQLADHVEQDLGIKSGEIVFWILHKYLKPQGANQYGINRWEDVKSRVIPNLRKFEILKNKKKIPPEQRDLNRLKSLSELEALVDQFDEQDLQSQGQQSKSVEQQMYQNRDAKLIHDDAQIKVVQPLTEKGSCYFGINTKWCTAGKEDNMFHKYAPGGPIYIVLIKKENRRYQFHWCLTVEHYLQDVDLTSPDMQEHVNNLKDHQSQFMDEQDKPINPNELADQHPVLWQVFGPIAQKNNSLILNPDPSLALQKSEVARNPELIKYIKNPSLAVQALAVAHDPAAIRYIKTPDPALDKHADVIRSRLEKEQKAARDAAKAAEEVKKKQERRDRLLRTFKKEIMQSDMSDTLDYYVGEIQAKTQNQVFDTLDQKQLNQLIQLQRLRLQDKLTQDDVYKAVQSGVINADQAKHFRKYPTAASLPGRETISGPSRRS
jgi:hypothetical protein